MVDEDVEEVGDEEHEGHPEPAGDGEQEGEEAVEDYGDGLEEEEEEDAHEQEAEDVAFD